MTTIRIREVHHGNGQSLEIFTAGKFHPVRVDSWKKENLLDNVSNFYPIIVNAVTLTEPHVWFSFRSFLTTHDKTKLPIYLDGFTPPTYSEIPETEGATVKLV